MNLFHLNWTNIFSILVGYSSGPSLVVGYAQVARGPTQPNPTRLKINALKWSTHYATHFRLDQDNKIRTG